MKLHKLISRTVLATALLGTTFGVFSGINASAGTGPVSNADYNSDSGASDRNKDSSNNVSKDFKTINGTDVEITDGYLNLDSTPQFHFGNNSQAVKNSNNSDSTNGSSLGLNNATGPLKVTDYRASSNKGSNSTNWGLSVTVSNFSIDQQNKSNTQSNAWKINFTPSNSNMSSLTSDKNTTTTLKNTGAGSNGSDKPTVMNGGYGSTTADYNSNSSANADQKANLYVPYNVQPGNYTTDMTWNLSTNINSDLNKPT